MDPAKKKSHKQIKKALASKQKHGLEDDARFTHAATDPTFRGGRKKHKLKIDPRFKGALEDDRFGIAQGKVDKRGRKVDKSEQGESLAPFYELDDGLTSGERSRRAELDALARGEQDDASSSSDDESSGDESDELEEVEVRPWDADLPPTFTEVENVEAARLAVTDQEWKHCRAQDFLVMLQSLCPPGGTCASVVVYASEYGAREMAREEKYGPGGIFIDEEQEEASDSGSELEAEEGFDAEKLRAYELKKLRRFFAVGIFDCASTAEAVYASGDGVEIEATSVPLNLAFIPEETTFDEGRKRDAATSAEAYKPPKAYVCAARQQTKVQCTFDDDDGRRKDAFEDMMRDPDAGDDTYLADSDGSDDDDNAKAANLRKMLGLDVSEPKSTVEGFDDDFFGAAEGETTKDDVEVTFDDFGSATPEADAEASKETPWEARERRKRERKAERKKMLKGKQREAQAKKAGGSAFTQPTKGGEDDQDDRDYDASKLVRAEKLAAKPKLKGKRKRERDALAAQEDRSGFAFDAKDDRFRALVDGDARFGVDTSANEFKKTAGMTAVLEEQSARRRAARGDDAARDAAAHLRDADDDAPAVGDLAASVRAKLAKRVKKKKSKAKK
jgi:hypothetical protein